MISDDSVFIKGALQEVLMSLMFAVVVVLIVIAVFLGQWKAVLIPAVTMPVSLVGTLAAIWLAGFSVNMLTLLALVLATGLIVDDAIVVLENIQRRKKLGESITVASLLGTKQVFFAVIATTASLVAVFLPIAFLPGETGRLFRVRHGVVDGGHHQYFCCIEPVPHAGFKTPERGRAFYRSSRSFDGASSSVRRSNCKCIFPYP